jgi:hypothetical protein
VKSPPPAEPSADAPVLAPLEAAGRFLPPGLLGELSMRMEELIALGVILAPAIRKFTENMRRSI